MRVVCCVCNKVKTQHGWHPLSVRTEERSSHGFCPACHRRMLRMTVAHGNKADHATIAA